MTRHWTVNSLYFLSQTILTGILSIIMIEFFRLNTIFPAILCGIGIFMTGCNLINELNQLIQAKILQGFNEEAEELSSLDSYKGSFDKPMEKCTPVLAHNIMNLGSNKFKYYLSVICISLLSAQTIFVTEHYLQTGIISPRLILLSTFTFLFTFWDIYYLEKIFLLEGKMTCLVFLRKMLGKLECH